MAKTDLTSYIGTTYPDPQNQFWNWNVSAPFVPVTGSGNNAAYHFTSSDVDPTMGTNQFGNGSFGGIPDVATLTFSIVGASNADKTLTIAFNDANQNDVQGYNGTYHVLGLTNDVILLSNFNTVQNQTVYVAITPDSPADPGNQNGTPGYFQPYGDNFVYPALTVDAAWATDGKVYTPPPTTAVPPFGAPPCFVSGTRIFAAQGDVAVEDIRPGDFVHRAAGGLTRVVWVGQRTVAPARQPSPQKLHPILVAADAFAPGVPQRDLYLSPDHAVFQDGVLIPVVALCNGVTIRQVERASVTYHHIETERHDAILAENLAAETYLDMANRHAFDGPGMTLRPDFSAAAPVDGFAPRVTSGGAVQAVRARLLARVAERGYAVADDADLHVLADGVRIDAEHGRFALPAGAAEVRIMSRHGVAAHVSAATADDRRLGVALDRLGVETPDGARDVLADPALAAGWHAMEGGWRWTDGAATLPPSLLHGATHLTLSVVAAAPHWVATETAQAA